MKRYFYHVNLRVGYVEEKVKHCFENFNNFLNLHLDSEMHLVYS